MSRTFSFSPSRELLTNIGAGSGRQCLIMNNVVNHLFMVRIMSASNTVLPLWGNDLFMSTGDYCLILEGNVCYLHHMYGVL